MNMFMKSANGASEGGLIQKSNRAFLFQKVKETRAMDKSPGLQMKKAKGF